MAMVAELWNSEGVMLGPEDEDIIALKKLLRDRPRRHQKSHLV